jgi:hypothetical protein
MGLPVRITAALLISIAAFAGTPGSFRGILYHGTDTKPGWWYVVGRNDSLRLVYIGKAVAVIYADEVPQQDRRAVPAQSITPGAEVRITAEQDDHGAWRATEVEILSVKGGRKSASRSAPGS